MKKKIKVRKKSIWKDRASWSLLVLCLPALVGYIVFNYIPMAGAIVIPFKDYKFAKGIWGSDWSGLNNFKWILHNAGILSALRNTFLYGLWFMLLGPINNVLMALLLFEVRSKRALKTYQTVITFPNFMSMVVVGYVTYAFLAPRGGFLNVILEALGLNPVDVYMNASWWPLILTIVSTWKGIGMGSMMYFASLVGIDSALFEAAEIDGANRFQKMRYISIPHLIPLVCIFTIMHAGSLISGSFDLFYIIPRGVGVLYPTTDILNTYVYRAMTKGSYAMGATVGFIQAFVGMILVIIANTIVRKVSPENSMF